MIYPKVNSNDARLLVRSLGLLLNQAAVYGPIHNVTKSATKRVYGELIEMLQRYSVLELTVKNDLICVNGRSEDLDSSISFNLIRRFGQIDISGLLLRLPLPVREFERIVNILGMSVAMLSEAEGVANLFIQKNITSADIVKVDYKRVLDGSETEDVEDVDSTAPRVIDAVQQDKGAMSSADRGVFDLSLDLLGADPEAEIIDPSETRVAAKKEREQQSLRLAGLLKKTAESLENSSSGSRAMELGRVEGALEMVRSALLEMTVGSEKNISSFAQDVSEDKMMVADLEEDARRRGYPLKLTREELLERYAEINQEIIQPLTVSTAVIEMLRMKNTGNLSTLQNELLKMAHESVSRVNELVDHLQSVSGLPHSYTPDESIIEKSRFVFTRN